MGRPMLDLTGQIFGKLTVIEHEPDSGPEFWLCKCECGNFILAKRAHLRAGNTKSCGCLRVVDLNNQIFGRLTVIEYSPEKSKWLCLCKCGKYKWILPATLKKGNAQSCGCLQKERAAQAQFKHGMHDSKIYNTWTHVKDRCLNPNNKYYSYYGGRGITICERWLDFDNFHADLGDPTEDKERISLDRIDNNGNYEPGNCRWVNQKVQNNNKRNSKFFTYEGETHTLPEWAEKVNMSYGQLRQRIYQRGWDFEKAITTIAQYSPTLSNTNNLSRS